MYKIFVSNNGGMSYSLYKESKSFDEVKMIGVGLNQELKRWYIENEGGEISGVCDENRILQKLAEEE